MEKQSIIWTDFERINMTHFRISTSCDLNNKCTENAWL